jgi:hypothetical protein
MRDRNRRIFMAGLDPAIPFIDAQPCHVITAAGSSQALTADQVG